VALGFQLCNGQLIGLEDNKPADLFADKAFDYARQKAMEIAVYLRSVMGEIEPARLPMHELEYTTMPQVLEKLKGRFKPMG